MKNKRDVYTHHFFPYYFITLGIALIPLIIIPVYPLLSVGVLILTLLFITTHYRVKIDMDGNTYREHLWILGFKYGKKKPLPDVEHVCINKSTRDEEYGLVARLSAHKTVFMGFIKFTNGETIFFGESRKEEKVRKKANEIADLLKTEIRKNYQI